MFKLISIFGQVPIVNSRCCYVKKLIPLSTFLKFHTHPEENLVRSFQNVFDKSSRVNSCISKKTDFFMNIAIF